MVIKAIIFDCFGVLVTSARVVLKKDYPQYKNQIDDLNHQADYGLISRHQFDEQLSNLIGITPDQVESNYWQKSVRDDDTINWLRQLKKSGTYKIGMLSNVGRGFMDSFFTPLEQREMFDEVILSSDVDLAKPEIAIFELMADRLGVEPNECIMIDDTALNVEAAKNAGMQGIWFVSTDTAQNEFDIILGSNYA